MNSILLMRLKAIATVLEQFRLLERQKAIISKSSFFPDLFTWREEIKKYPSTKKVLVYMQKFRSLWLIVQKELIIKASRIIILFVPGSRIFLAKAVYMVLGSA